METYLFVLFVTIALNLLPIKLESRKKWMLPISFLILFVFLAIRYDYGVDYSHYEHTFYYPELYSRDFGREPLFWLFFYSFKYYYQFIIAQSFLLCLTYYYFVNKYMSPKYYSFFFMVFMCYPGMMFTSIAAMRSSVAAIVFLWGTEFFFLRNYKPLFYIGTIVAAFLCHQSASQLLVIPIAYRYLNRISTKTWGIIMVSGILISMTSITSLVENALGFFSEDTIGDYAKYLGDKFEESTLSHAILRLFMLVSGFIIYNLYVFQQYKESNIYKIAIIAILYMSINSFGLDFQSRSAVLMFLFVIISMSNLFDAKYNKTIKYLFVSLFLFYVIWYNYVMFVRLKMLIGMPGNFLFYQTIFDIPNLP